MLLLLLFFTLFSCRCLFFLLFILLPCVLHSPPPVFHSPPPVFHSPPPVFILLLLLPVFHSPPPLPCFSFSSPSVLHYPHFSSVLIFLHSLPLIFSVSFSTLLKLLCHSFFLLYFFFPFVVSPTLLLFSFLLFLLS